MKYLVKNVSDLTLSVWPFQSITTHVHVTHVNTLPWKLVDQRGVYFMDSLTCLSRPPLMPVLGHSQLIVSHPLSFPPTSIFQKFILNIQCIPNNYFVVL